MKCYKPVMIKYVKRNKITGNKEGPEKRLMVRCGKCLACREEIAKEYTYRFMNEYTYFEYLYFITLTYRDEDIPKNADGFETLNKKHIVDYLKVINVNVARDSYIIDKKYKYFVGAEYGDQTMRPHYHVSILCNDERVGQYFMAKWKYGNIDFQIGDMRSVFYVIGYSNKKIGDNDKYYDDLGLERPFRKFSKGLGKDYYEERKHELAGKYYGQLGYSRIALPNYYKNKLKESELVDINELTRKAEENNLKLLEFYKKTYDDGYTLDDYLANSDIQNIRINQTLKQKERNYKAKYSFKKSRNKI